MSRPKEKTVFMAIMYIVSLLSIIISTMELFQIGWKIIQSILQKNITITFQGHEIIAKNPLWWAYISDFLKFKAFLILHLLFYLTNFSVAAIKRGLETVDRDFGYQFYSDPVNQDLRIHLPIENCLLLYKNRLEDRELLGWVLQALCKSYKIFMIVKVRVFYSGSV